VILQGKSHPFCYLFLTLFNHLIRKLLHHTTIYADNMVVVLPSRKLKDCLPTIKIVALY
jgi:hypothetical protein